jgi:hypothetical protein
MTTPDPTIDSPPRLPWYVRFGPWINATVGVLAAAALVGVGLLWGRDTDRADAAEADLGVVEVQADKGLDLAAEVDRRCRAGGVAAAELGSLCAKAREVQDAPAPVVRDGLDGVGIARVDTGECALTIRLTDGREDTLTDLCGEPGKDAPAGRGISSTEQDGCFVTLTYTDALTQRLGPFCGVQGPRGEKGEPGLSPPCLSEPYQCRGPIGPRGEDGNPAQTQTFTLPDGRTFSCARDDGSPDTAPTYTCSQTSPPNSAPEGPQLPIPGG